MSKRFIAVVVGGFTCFAALVAFPAAAQETPGPVVQQGGVDQVAPPDQIDRVVGPQRGGGFRAPEGVKVVHPGALLFASFDRNFDGRVTREEIDTGAAGAFVAADRNRDGVIKGFEQNDWAASIGSTTDVLSNPMTFDADLDRTVTRDEFAAGLKRIAGQGDLAFADLMKPLSRPGDQASNGGGPVIVGPGQRPNASASKN